MCLITDFNRFLAKDSWIELNKYTLHEYFIL